MRIACLLLAAGGGTRFGGDKPLARVDGKPLIRHSLDVLAPVFGTDLFVVLGAARDRIEPLVARPARVVEHAGWRDGLGSSIARGMREIRSETAYHGVLIALADQVRLTGRDFNDLLAPFDGERIVAALYTGRPGVPAIFPRALFARLEQLDGDRGARKILRQPGAEIVTVALPLAEYDIDRPGDIDRQSGR